MAERDFFREPLSEDEIRDLAKGHSLSDLFAWRSPSFKALRPEAGALRDDDMVRLMLQEPRLIRRPMVQIGDELIIGADIKRLESALEG